MFTKTLTAGVLALSMSLTSLAPTQAQASFSEEDAIVGIISLLLLGAAIHNRNDNDEPVRPRVDPNAWRVLPASCLRGDTRRTGGAVRFFGQRCMTTQYHYVSRLPAQCRVQFRNRRGEHRAGWQARCLRNQGFRISRH